MTFNKVIVLRLSERNCVEVVSMLMASKAIDIVFTSDGHAYLTKKHLLTEIKNECIGRGQEYLQLEGGCNLAAT